MPYCQDVERVFSNHERYFWPPDGGTLPPLRVVDNQSWYQAMNIVDFLSTVGRYFRIGTSCLPRLCGINFKLDPDPVSKNVRYRYLIGIMRL